MVVDLETTSLDVATAGVVQIGVAGFFNGEALKVQCTLCNPMVDMDAEAQAVHGISLADTLAHPHVTAHKDTLIKSLLRFDALVGYGIYNFDLPILDRLLGPEWVAARSRIPVIDVLPIVRLNAVSGGWQGKGRHRLASVAERLGVSVVGLDHNASVDALKTGKVLWHLLRNPAFHTAQKLLSMGESDIEAFVRERHAEQSAELARHIRQRKLAASTSAEAPQ